MWEDGVAGACSEQFLHCQGGRGVPLVLVSGFLLVSLEKICVGSGVCVLLQEENSRLPRICRMLL